MYKLNGCHIFVLLIVGLLSSYTSAKPNILNTTNKRFGHFINEWSNLFRKEKSNFGDSSEFLIGGIKCIDCTENDPDCWNLINPKDFIKECIIHPEQNGCFKAEDKTRIYRGCLSDLSPELFQYCELSDLCKTCYTDNCNNNDQPFGQFNSAQATHVSLGSVLSIMIINFAAIYFSD